MTSGTTEAGAIDRRNEPIAIVGMACSLAGGVESPREFWETMINGEIKLSETIPKSRFNIDAYFREDSLGRPGAIASKGGFFLNTDTHAFDAEFFGISADEAKHMDPQQFRILESVYECLESAGKTLQDIKGTNTAAYIGTFGLDQVIASVRHGYDDRHLHEVAGVDPGLLSARVSYFFDLNGPTYTTNAGCTSSLFALHTAAMALRGGEVPAAIVGGVNLVLGPEAYSSYSKFGIMSPDSMCHSYDARCNGYARAEGSGALYVKLLSDAIRDNDPIRGVVRSIAVTANGMIPDTPLFIPNEAGMAKCLDLAYSQAGLDPAETAYVETHGVGMIPGEIAEAHSIGKFMNNPTRRAKPLPIGSLKPNFGHQEGASGIFILMKAAMMTEAGVIPGHVNFNSAHPAIDLEDLNIKPQQQTINWPSEYSVRRVGACSYGWTGTNVHSLVEAVHTLHPEYRLGQRRETADYDHTVTRPLLLTFSAVKDSSLQASIAAVAQVADEFYAADLAYTLNLRRTKFDLRAAAVVGTSGSLTSDIAHSLTSGSVTDGEGATNIMFSFTEPGQDLIPLACELKQHFPVFSSSMDAIGITIDTSTAIQMALVDLLKDWNIVPSVILQTDTAAAKCASSKVRDVPYASADSPHVKDAAVGIDISKVHSLAGLLSLAGELFNAGIPIDLEKINATSSVGWKPFVAVDLPHYVWDHSKTYSDETQANLEFNQSSYPYHELLGRRVYGLSPATMVWRNKLSFHDLPDKMPPTPKPKPATTIGTADFISIVAEALHQGFGNAPDSGWTIRNFKVFQPLNYENDVNLIEVHTSITETSDASYKITIQSVREGVWTKHCEASMSEPSDRADSPLHDTQVAAIRINTGMNKSAAKGDEVQNATTAFDLDSKLEGQKLPDLYHVHPSLVSAALEVAVQHDVELGSDRENLSALSLDGLTIFESQSTLGGKFSITTISNDTIEVRTDGGDDAKPVVRLQGVHA